MPAMRKKKTTDASASQCRRPLPNWFQVSPQNRINAEKYAHAWDILIMASKGQLSNSDIERLYEELWAS